MYFICNSVFVVQQLKQLAYPTGCDVNYDVRKKLFVGARLAPDGFWFTTLLYAIGANQNAYSLHEMVLKYIIHVFHD